MGPKLTDSSLLEYKCTTSSKESTTTYTLRNAEYRLCLERNLDIYEDNYEKQNNENELLVGGHKTWSEKIDGVSKSSRDVLHEGEGTEEDLSCEKSYVEAGRRLRQKGYRSILAKISQSDVPVVVWAIWFMRNEVTLRGVYYSGWHRTILLAPASLLIHSR
ncbi:hypothetical protein QJS10_CPB13g00478 [Acorus calamus]|uniref:Uncharacterized protein n=1 Tax=Acorus calamus TaxID=4465 RepID=A0AAV9DJX8_ACOCL|nr:hypothetical protein QJS10_CPB13g00478 [Acorus calamus]